MQFVYHMLSDPLPVQAFLPESAIEALGVPVLPWPSGVDVEVFDLVERLRAAGVSVWIDQMGIEGASMWNAFAAGTR